MNYSEKLKDPRWQKKRLEILERDEFTCQSCTDKATELHVHHIKYTENPWDAPPADLITYCKYCHLIHETIKKKYPGTKVIQIIKRSYVSTVFIPFSVLLDYEQENKHRILAIFFCSYQDGRIDYDFLVDFKGLLKEVSDISEYIFDHYIDLNKDNHLPDMYKNWKTWPVNDDLPFK